MNFQTMNKQRKFILIAAVAGIISVFLPWVTISVFGITKNINGFHGWGIPVFLAFVTTAVITISGNQTQALEKGSWFLSMACGAVALLSIVITVSSGSADEGMGFVDTSVGAGLWIAIASSLGILLFAWLFKSPSDSLKSGFEGLKNSISIPASSSPVSAPGTSATDQPAKDQVIKAEKVTILQNPAISEESLSDPNKNR